MAIFVMLDPGRRALAFYDDLVHPEIPPGTVPIGDALHLEWCGRDALRWRLSQDGAGLEECEPPDPPPPPSYQMDAADWRDRFTDAEKGAITLAASRAMEAGDPSLQVFLDDLAIRRTVYLDNPRLIAGVNALVAAKLITAKRRAALLAP